MDVFAALADPTRREVIRRLADDGPATATQLAAQFTVSRQAVSKHLGFLGDAGLVTSTKQGRETLYELQPAALNEALSWMATVGAAWDTRLASLEKLLAQPKSRRRR